MSSLEFEFCLAVGELRVKKETEREGREKEKHTYTERVRERGIPSK